MIRVEWAISSRLNDKEWEGRALRNRQVAYFSVGARLPRGRRDWETGNFYLPTVALAKVGGARYYDPKISVWLSVDPKAYAFTSVTPYSFMMNNSILFIDPARRR